MVEKLVNSVVAFFDKATKVLGKVEAILDKAGADDEPKFQKDFTKKREQLKAQAGSLGIMFDANASIQELERLIALEQMTQEEPAPTAPKEKIESNADKRERIKARARELGIEFSPSTRTASLEKRIAEAEDLEKKLLAKHAEPAPKEEEVAAPAPEAKEATRDEAQGLLVSISTKVGKPDTLDILERVTGQRRLKDVPDDPKLYGAIVAECEKVLANASK
jgi:uncharacterized protein (DUF1697 family)